MSRQQIPSAAEVFGRMGSFSGLGLILLFLVVAFMSRAGCSNHHTPPGFAGYIRSQPLVGAGEFVGTLVGPASTGWVWRQKVVNIDIRPRTYSEEMKIPTSNQAYVTLRAHVRVQALKTLDAVGGDNNKRQAMLQALIEQDGGANWFAANVRDRFRSSVRDKVQKLEPFEVKNQIVKIGDEVLAEMKAAYSDRAAQFLSVDIGDIQYPEGVVQSVIRKLVTYQENERAAIQADIAREQIKIGSAEAEGVAKAQEVIRTTLDPMFLQFEALRAIETLSTSDNTTFLISPMSEKGTSPVIMNLGNGN